MLFSGRQTKRCTLLGLLAAAVVVGGVVPVAAADEASDKRTEAASIAGKLDELDARLMELGAEYERVNFELHKAESAVAEAEKYADQTQRELEAREEDLRRYAVAAYQDGNDSRELDAVLTSEPGAGALMHAYIEAGSGRQQDYLDALKAVRQTADTDADRLAQARANAERKASEIASAREDAAAAREQQAALDARVQGELAALVAQEQARLQSTSSTTAPRNGGNGDPPPPPPSPSPAAPAPARAPVAPSPTVASPPPPQNDGNAASIAIAAAVSQVGKTYVWGAAGPDAYDCSGILLWAYAKAGISLPHYSGAMYNMTTRISASQLQPGDLVFWGGGGSEHVAMYMGGNQLVHAFGSMRGVAVTNLAGWWKTPSGYGRLNL